MGWEERNGNYYYYRKVRVEGTVKSKYVGRGPFAEAIAEIDQLQREKRRMEQLSRKKRRECMQKQVRAVEKARRVVRMIRDATFLANGYHNHKGQWRKRRGATNRSAHEGASEDHEADGN